MDIKDLRVEIDKIDMEFVKLFEKRMKVIREIARFKKENNFPILDMQREREKLDDITKKSSDDMSLYVRTLYSSIFQMSNSYQAKLNKRESKIISNVIDAIENTEKIFPKNITIACQGVEGANSQQACDKLFGMPNIVYFSDFEGVFSAIDKGLYKYGVLPVENSTAGSVNKIYGLMMKYKFNIVRSMRLKIDYNLLAKKGTSISDIKEIISHEQSIRQCAGYLNRLKNIKVTVCENTAKAAKIVSESDRNDIAAISAPLCEELYGLVSLDKNIQDEGNNHTRFICISKNIEIYPGADKTSIMMVIKHKPGALYNILAKFYVLGINLTKIESRPIANKNFEFMFYFDIEVSVYSEEFLQLLEELEVLAEDFRYLGSYSELI